MSNTTRIINNPPLEYVNSEDLLSTNVFIPQTENEDISDIQKKQFMRYYEDRKRSEQVKKAINRVNENDYDYFAGTNNNFSLNSSVVIKSQKDVKKIEKLSIIDIDTRNRNLNAYPQPSHFIIPLGKTFYNIKKIELVSTAIPNTDQTITNTPIQIRNNKISWQNAEDVDLGIYKNVSISQNIPDFLDITIPAHGLSSQVRDGDFYVNISKSTTNPSINGKRFAEILDADTIRIPFTGGITATATANVDVGFPTYTVELTPGNYNATTITEEIAKQMNLVKRNNNSGEIFHFFTVEINLDTDVMTFSSYITKQLSTGPISTTIGTGVVTVYSLAHGYKTGDLVLMIGVKNIGGLTASILNGLFRVTVLNSDSFSYEVNERASAAEEGGGSTVKTGRPSEFRLIFDIADSLIVNNIGFPKEDSSVYIGTSETPITTKTLSITDAQQVGNYVRFTSPSHGLEGAVLIEISDISTGEFPKVTTTTPHGLEDRKEAFIKYLHTSPILNGVYSIRVTGINTFILNTVNIIENSGGLGSLKHSGDRIKLNGFKSVPKISENIYMIENSTTNTFDIEQSLISIQESSIPESVIGTEQIFVNHENHGFNSITSVSASGSTKALVKTLTNHGLSGVKYEGVSIETVILNTVDISITGHGLSTSDTIFISNSNSSPSINGTYVIQTIDVDTFRISFIGGIVAAATCDINFGDKVVFSITNSVPDITTDVNGNTEFYINKISDTEFEIDTGFLITSPGDSGILGREQSIALHRIEPDQIGSDNLGGIPISVLNSNYYNIQKIIDENNYMIRVGRYANYTVSGGSSNVSGTSQIHGFRTFQSNTVNGERDGVLFKSISLEGENYVFLVSPNLHTVFSPGNEKVGDVFAKILLNEPPGVMMFDSFISAPREFNPPLAVLNSLEFSVKRQDGYLFNFNNIDFSMSLRVTEIVDQIEGSNISSRTGASDLYSS